MNVNTIERLLLPAIALFLFGQLAIAAASECQAQHDAAGQWHVEPKAEGLGVTVANLCDLLKSVVHGAINIHGVVVERHGQLMGEAYRRGKDESVYSLFSSTKDFDADTLHDIRSISKSIVSLLWGIAEGQRKTPPLDTPALDLLPELSKYKNAGRETITLKHLFTMSSGLDWYEMGNYGALGNDETKLYWRSSQAKYLFDRAMIARPGERFNYDGGGTAVIAQILEQRVGMPLPEYARKNLFEPLGITEWEWKNDLRGRTLAFAGLRMKPRDLARIGRLVLANGTREGKQIVPANWIAESTRAHIDADSGMRYGYFWWLGNNDEPSFDFIVGTGNGGEKLFLVPALDIVVVMTAGDYNKKEIHLKERQLLNDIVMTLSH